MNTAHTEPTTYGSPVALFRLGSEKDIDVKMLARVFHARSTRTGVTFADLDAADLDAIEAGMAHVVDCIGEALRGTVDKATLRDSIDASFRGGRACASIMRHAEDDLGMAISDDERFRSRLRGEGERPESDVLRCLRDEPLDGTAAPSKPCDPRPESTTVVDND